MYKFSRDITSLLVAVAFSFELGAVIRANSQPVVEFSAVGGGSVDKLSAKKNDQYGIYLTFFHVQNKALDHYQLEQWQEPEHSCYLIQWHVDYTGDFQPHRYHFLIPETHNQLFSI